MSNEKTRSLFEELEELFSTVPTTTSTTSTGAPQHGRDADIEALFYFKCTGPSLKYAWVTPYYNSNREKPPNALYHVRVTDISDNFVEAWVDPYLDRFDEIVSFTLPRCLSQDVRYSYLSFATSMLMHRRVARALANRDVLGAEMAIRDAVRRVFELNLVSISRSDSFAWVPLVTKLLQPLQSSLQWFGEWATAVAADEALRLFGASPHVLDYYVPHWRALRPSEPDEVKVVAVYAVDRSKAYDAREVWDKDRLVTVVLSDGASIILHFNFATRTAYIYHNQIVLGVAVMYGRYVPPRRVHERLVSLLQNPVVVERVTQIAVSGLPREELEERVGEIIVPLYRRAIEEAAGES